ncbi:MAG: hypothetical protein PHE59_01160 [Patescibacteria group bacterium]|nr:hypothetical protein [Patescibacteria group bacterium]MDD5164280.1 hypothetical protein [Patescibacteria group bacterium]MDD5535039.1 hypothetical protein [Patescibacteria group bacterium]
MSKIQTNSGQIRKKREDTLIKNIEKQYGVNFGVRGDEKLGTYLRDKGLPSLSKALVKVTKKR